MQWKLIITRKEKHLKQEDLAKLLKISTDAYGMKERSQLQFKADEMFILSDYFDKKIEQLFLPSNFGNTEKEGGVIHEKS